MADVVVTVPQSFGLRTWIEEGTDLPGRPWSGLEWHFSVSGNPNVARGDRVYVVYKGAVRGYAPLVRLERNPWNPRQCALVRHGGAVAVTIPLIVPGFRGFRYRWWSYEQELSFPAWMDPDADPTTREGREGC